jgi:hypothetical protein
VLVFVKANYFSGKEDEEFNTGQIIVARWNWQRKNYFID